MRTETTTETFYAFEELSEEAQATAIDLMREQQYQWIEWSEMTPTIVYGIAEALKAPGWDTYGSGDFPGIEGFEVSEWDLDRGTIVGSGTLTQETAPNLPWGVFEAFHFTTRDYDAHATYENEDGYTVEVGNYMQADDPAYETWAELEQAVREALASGLSLANQEVEYLSGEEWARMACEDDGQEMFAEDGTF